MVDKVADKKNKCPNCSKASVKEFRPFCSVRCCEVDLARWLGGKYSVPVDETESADKSNSKNSSDDAD